MAPFPIILGHEGAPVCSALNFWAWVQLKCVSLKKSTFAGAGEVESIGEGVRDLKVTIFSSEETQQMPLSLFLEAPTHFLWQERKIMSFDISSKRYQVGDPVIPCGLPHCGKCALCLHPRCRFFSLEEIGENEEERENGILDMEKTYLKAERRGK